jgi:hypothetical protein
VETRRVRIVDSPPCEYMLLLSNGMTLARPHIVVVDGPLTRDIEWQSTTKIEQMLTDAKSAAAQVRFTCESRDALCRPFLLWATRNPN